MIEMESLNLIRVGQEILFVANFDQIQIQILEKPLK